MLLESLFLFLNRKIHILFCHVFAIEEIGIYFCGNLDVLQVNVRDGFLGQSIEIVYRDPAVFACFIGARAKYLRLTLPE